MPDDISPLIPDKLRSRFVALYDGHAPWGYLHGGDDEISKRRSFGRERAECLVEECFRVLPPAPGRSGCRRHARLERHLAARRAAEGTVEA